MGNQEKAEKELALEKIIIPAVQIPGVKVDRNKFLSERFGSEDVVLQDVLNYGPIQAGCTKEQLSRIAQKLILIRTSESSAASFVAGIPGGFAMAATIPADVMQFFGMALRLAQELSYLYGAADIWQNGKVDEEQVQNQLILYCGVMLGVSGAATGVRVLTTQVAKTAAKKIPQKALTKTFWYPIIKQIGKAVGIKVTKSTVAQGVGKVVPLIGGVISGALNFVSMRPMANRLQSTLEKANFDYTEEELNADIDEIACVEEEATSDGAEKTANEAMQMKDKVQQGIKSAGAGLSGMLSKFGKRTEKEAVSDGGDIVVKLKQLSELKDCGVITQEEFTEKKAELLSKM